DLTAMRVAAQLQADALRGGLDDLLGLMGKQDEFAARIAAFQGALQVRPMAAAEAAGAPVIDACEIEAIVAIADADMLVSEHADPEAIELRDPLIDARVVLVVAGDEEDAMFGAKLSERRDFIAESGHRAIDEIAGDHHDVGVERVDAI